MLLQLLYGAKRYLDHHVYDKCKIKHTTIVLIWHIVHWIDIKSEQIEEDDFLKLQLQGIHDVTDLVVCYFAASMLHHHSSYYAHIMHNVVSLVDYECLKARVGFQAELLPAPTTEYLPACFTLHLPWSSYLGPPALDHLPETFCLGSPPWLLLLGTCCLNLPAWISRQFFRQARRLLWLVALPAQSRWAFKVETNVDVWYLEHLQRVKQIGCLRNQRWFSASSS